MNFVIFFGVVFGGDWFEIFLLEFFFDGLYSRFDFFRWTFDGIDDNLFLTLVRYCTLYRVCFIYFMKWSGRVCSWG